MRAQNERYTLSLVSCSRANQIKQDGTNGKINVSPMISDDR